MADEELKARIDHLEALVAELGRRLEQDKSRFGSMRDTRRCPACGGGSLVHFRRPQEVGRGSGRKGLVDFALDHTYSVMWGTTKTRAPLEAFACRGCGLVEWHARDFDGIAADGLDIAFIEPEPAAPASGPFR